MHLAPEFEFLIPQWEGPANVRACATTRKGGVSQGPYASLNLGTHVSDRPEDVAENRRRLTSALGLEKVAWLEQVHGTDVLRIHGCVDDVACADASVTRDLDTACVVMTADCLPVLFCDRQGSVVAAAHAGWRGLQSGVLEATLESMAVEPSQVMAWLGPAIGPDAFEVGPEVEEAFAQRLGDVSRAFVAAQGDRRKADIYTLAQMVLSRAGVENISGGGACTYSEPERFFSYRRDAVTGRMASLIWLERG